MANGSQQVRPGDVISSELFNDLIDRMDRLEEQVAGAGIRVPDVFGLTLLRAQTILRAFSIGTVLDVDGDRVEPGDRASQGRLVLGQSPGAGTFAAAGAQIDLLLSAVTTPREPEAGDPLIDNAKIMEVRNVKVMVITGKNFSATNEKNEVSLKVRNKTFARLTPRESTTTRLVVQADGLRDDVRMSPFVPREVTVVVTVDGRASNPFPVNLRT